MSTVNKHLDMFSESFNLEGKVAIITSSSKGIGKAMAKGLAEKGGTAKKSY